MSDLPARLRETAEQLALVREAWAHVAEVPRLTEGQTMTIDILREAAEAVEQIARLRTDLAIEREAIAPIYADRDRLRLLLERVQQSTRLDGTALLADIVAALKAPQP